MSTATHTHLKLPLPLHGQFKALAAKRGRTMVDLIADQVQQAIDAGELADETPGFALKAVLDFNGDPKAEITVSTPAGDLPVMTPDELASFAWSLTDARPGRDPDIVNATMLKTGRIEVSCVGTGIAIEASTRTGIVTRLVVTPRTARDLARQFAALAKRTGAK